MGLGDNAAGLAPAESALALFPIDKDALTGPRPLEILARVQPESATPTAP
jgi:hypothetical protein